MGTMTEGTVSWRYTQHTPRNARAMDAEVIGEAPRVLYVNKRLLVTFMCTPIQVHHLALGFLLSEGLIRDLDEVLMMRIYEDRHHCYWYLPAFGLDEVRRMPVDDVLVGTIDVRVKGPLPDLGPRILTSGCGGGITFDDLSHGYPPLNSSMQISVTQVLNLMRRLHESATLYRTCRGVHTSAISDGERLLAVAADVGRHNTLDKLRGECALRGIPTKHRILLSTGRISSEMLTKAVKMQIPIVISRTSPTSLSIQLARQWGITLIGYVRHQQFNVYTGEERIRSASSQMEHVAETLTPRPEPAVPG
ncbi:MAG: formate dehydrogenase accessory sulfurtransferase FdhD [Anaerolineae bacterium]